MQLNTKILCALLFVFTASGCYVPVLYYDFRNLSDNLVDGSIKKHIRPYVQLREADNLRADYLEAFPLGSSSKVAVSYLASIGGQCRAESPENEREIDQCKYETSWGTYQERLLSNKFMGNIKVIVRYTIESSNGKIEDVVVDCKLEKLEHINRRADR